MTYYIDGARGEETLVSAIELLLTGKVPAVDGVVDAWPVLISVDNTTSYILRSPCAIKVHIIM